MTPKEKAKEIFIKILDQFPEQSAIHFDKNLFVKNLAIAYVDEILELPVCWYSKEMADKNDEDYPHSATEEYWQKVKEELINPTSEKPM